MKIGANMPAESKYRWKIAMLALCLVKSNKKPPRKGVRQAKGVDKSYSYKIEGKDPLHLMAIKNNT